MTDESGNVIKTSVSLPPYLYEWLHEIVKVDKQRFPSYSSVVVIALSELKGRIEAREEVAGKQDEQCDIKQPEKTEFEKLIEAYLRTSEGQDYIKKLQQKKNNPNTETIFKSDYARRDILE